MDAMTPPDRDARAADARAMLDAYADGVRTLAAWWAGAWEGWLRARMGGESLPLPRAERARIVSGG